MLLFALGTMAGEVAPVSQGMARAWMGFFRLHPLQTRGCLPSKLDNYPPSPDNYHHQSRIMISPNCAAPPKERGDWVFFLWIQEIGRRWLLKSHPSEGLLETKGNLWDLLSPFPDKMWKLWMNQCLEVLQEEVGDGNEVGRGKGWRWSRIRKLPLLLCCFSLGVFPAFPLGSIFVRSRALLVWEHSQELPSRTNHGKIRMRMRMIHLLEFGN